MDCVRLGGMWAIEWNLVGPVVRRTEALTRFSQGRMVPQRNGCLGSGGNPPRRAWNLGDLRTCRVRMSSESDWFRSCFLIAKKTCPRTWFQVPWWWLMPCPDVEKGHWPLEVSCPKSVLSTVDFLALFRYYSSILFGRFSLRLRRDRKP